MKREEITLPVTLLNADVTQRSEKDRLKARSEGLFYIADGDQKKPFAVELDALTAGEMKTISAAADAIVKHFAIYKQRERDASGGKTGDYIFMVRVKNPAGGELTAAQWAALDEGAERFADKTLRLTSREGIQYHFVYLPRKFKVGIAHPRDNSIDLLTQDVGCLPVVNGKVADRYDLYTGGGLGITHNLPETQQLLGLYLGRVPREQVVDSVRAIAILQKEHSERKNRRQARWKYTVRRLGIDNVEAALRDRFGIRLADAEPQPIPKIRYHHGWHPEPGGKDCFYYGLPVENGRLRNTEAVQMRTAVRRIVEELDLGVRVTPNQDLLLCHVPADRREWVERVLKEHGVDRPEEISSVRKLAMACPAKPTCGLAMTDAERLLPYYVQSLEDARASRERGPAPFEQRPKSK